MTRPQRADLPPKTADAAESGIKTDLRLGYPQPGGGHLNFHFKFDLPGRGITAVVGPSGAGKTTFLRCLAGLERASGLLAINGRLWQDDNFFMPTHKRPLGYVFQEPSLFPHLSVRRNLDYGAKRRGRQGAANKVDLDKFIDILGIGHLMDRKPETLSGGEKQRTALARALAGGPEVLLLDEPLAALDQDRKEEIMPYLESLRVLTMPIIYVSHALEEVERLADTVVKMEENDGLAIGRVSGVGQGGPRCHLAAAPQLGAA
ncbi:ATP-binding cassette domain-containing protein [Deltaproteobacteria bacterium OttesenSCG-928-K17]|nr:ATP-binding cassette domain-containing protein [Deltaproteobacteria bacterium OttesenSCG-928-K17]